jgi:hypothetical protein
MRHELERWLLGTGDPISAKDIAQLVQARIDPEKRRVTESLLRSNQVLADAVAIQLMRNEETQTPTATSSVMFGPSSDEHRAPSLVAGHRRTTKPSVRFSPFSSVSAPPESVRDSDANSHTKETVRPTRPNIAVTPAEALDGATLRDELPNSRTQPGGPLESNSAALRQVTSRLAPLKRPYTWLAIGIVTAIVLLLALVWSSRRDSGSDPAPSSGEAR